MLEVFCFQGEGLIPSKVIVDILGFCDSICMPILLNLEHGGVYLPGIIPSSREKSIALPV